jgi:hypothetical protein
MDLISLNRIYTPSALRLLRIAAAKKCEIGLESVCSEKVYHNSHHLSFGVFACKECVYNCSQKFMIRKKADIARVGPALRSDKTCIMEKRMWRKPLVSKEGEIVGPRVTIELMDTLNSSEDVVDGSKTLEQAFDSFLQSPEMALTDETKWLLELYDRISSVADEFRHSERKRKANMRRDRDNIKKVKQSTIESNVAELVGDMEIGDIWIGSKLYKDLMKPILDAPSKSTKAVIKRIADNIRSTYSCIPKDFAEFKFLEAMPGNFGKSLRSVIVSKFASTSMTSRPYQNSNTSPEQAFLKGLGYEMLVLIKNGMSFEAMVFWAYKSGLLTNVISKCSFPHCSSSLAKTVWINKYDILIAGTCIRLSKIKSMDVDLDELDIPEGLSTSLETALEDTKMQMIEADRLYAEFMKFDWIDDKDWSQILASPSNSLWERGNLSTLVNLRARKFRVVLDSLRSRTFSRF